MNNISLKSSDLDAIYKNRAIRTAITRNSLLWFTNIYFADHMEYEIAPFQLEMIDHAEKDFKLLCIVAFRGSAKTTLMTTINSLWSILGVKQSKFVLIISSTQPQARQQMLNSRGVLEKNRILKDDLGPFKEESESWGGSSIVFSKIGAKISFVSVNEDIRGIKNLQHRPDLIIIDDPEDTQSAKTREGREKIYNWFKGELMPVGGPKTQVIVLGNLVHEHCLVMQLKEEIANNITTGIYKQYSLITDDDKSAWPGKFPTLEAIEEERKRIGNDRAWFREYLLKILPSEDQIIKPEWISYYSTLPSMYDPVYQYKLSASAVDLGIKNTESSDFTAIVSGHLFGSGSSAKIYISPNFFNGRGSFREIIEKIKQFSNLNRNRRSRTYIEDVQAQSYVIDELRSQGYLVEGFRPQGKKEERLWIISPLIQSGRILFHPGCREIINQIVNFGIENHDDLCDALVMLVIELSKFMGHGENNGNIIVGGTPQRGPDNSPNFGYQNNKLLSDWDDPEVGFAAMNKRRTRF